MATWPSVLIARDTCDKRLFVCVNMAYGGDERVRNPEWEDDETLKADLAKYVMQNLSRREIVDFLKRDFPQYAWSLGTLSRRLAHFDIKYVQ